MTFAGTNIPTGASSNDRINRIVDTYLTPRLEMFRSICVYDEQAQLLSDRVTWNLTFGNWLEGFDLLVRKNTRLVSTGEYSMVDYTKGQLQVGVVDLGPDDRPRDTVNVSYQFDYFPIAYLEGYILQSIETINTAAYGPATSFTIDTAPNNWDSALSDLSFAIAMEKLILDYDLWKGRLVFAVGPEVLDGSGGEIVSQLETLKTNAEERAYKSLDNEKFKVGNVLSAPTQAYFNSISGLGGAGRGRLRGLKINKIT